MSLLKYRYKFRVKKLRNLVVSFFEKLIVYKILKINLRKKDKIY